MRWMAIAVAVAFVSALVALAITDRADERIHKRMESDREAAARDAQFLFELASECAKTAPHTHRHEPMYRMQFADDGIALVHTRELYAGCMAFDLDGSVDDPRKAIAMTFADGTVKAVGRPHDKVLIVCLPAEPRPAQESAER